MGGFELKHEGVKIVLNFHYSFNLELYECKKEQISVLLFNCNPDLTVEGLT